MRATAHVRRPDSDHESAIVREIQRLLTDCVDEDLDKVDELLRLRRQGIRLVGAADGSVAVLFWCRRRCGLARLHEWLVNGRVRDAVKALVNRVMGRSSPSERIAIDLDWTEQDYDVCVEYFDRFFPGRSRLRQQRSRIDIRLRSIILHLGHSGLV